MPRTLLEWTNLGVKVSPVDYISLPLSPSLGKDWKDTKPSGRVSLSTWLEC